MILDEAQSVGKLCKTNISIELKSRGRHIRNRCITYHLVFLNRARRQQCRVAINPVSSSLLNNRFCIKFIAIRRAYFYFVFLSFLHIFVFSLLLLVVVTHFVLCKTQYSSLSWHSMCWTKRRTNGKKIMARTWLCGGACCMAASETTTNSYGKVADQPKYKRLIGAYRVI